MREVYHRQYRSESYVYQSCMAVVMARSRRVLRGGNYALPGAVNRDCGSIKNGVKVKVMKPAPRNRIAVCIIARSVPMSRHQRVCWRGELITGSACAAAV